MGESGLDKHQLAGLDYRERGFNRPVEFVRAGEQFCAILRYETIRISTDPHPGQDAALMALIRDLHLQGYRQLRTQVSFRNGIYLGSQELWVEYPDPAPPPKPAGLLSKILGLFRARRQDNTLS
ncbi:MAG: hypothetical protein Q7U39_08150 [Nitrospira sp.]|nr:hypothetical protein [Nitrospira sp.]